MESILRRLTVLGWMVLGAVLFALGIGVYILRVLWGAFSRIRFK